MRPHVVPLLRCPACRSDGPLSLATSIDREGEILEGTLRCDTCSGSFPITDGIARLLGSCSEVASKERAVYRRSREEVEKRIGLLPPEHKDEELRRIAFMEHTGDDFRLTSTLNLDGALRGVDPHPGEWLVELGAGSGWLTSRWATRGLRCIAMDLSPDLKLELSPLVMRQEGVYFDRLMGDMTNIPLRSGAVRWVFVSASLHHAEGLAASLAEAARVLEPGGSLVAINEPMHGIFRRSGKRFVDQVARDNPGLNEQSFSYLQWRHALRVAGLRPRFLFPPYYRAVLERRIRAPRTSGGFAALAAALWRSPLRHAVRLPWVMASAQLLLGLNVCMIARKESSRGQ
ncbi:methyltransferase domain-containing protein [Candidatus Fermentibacteria bacterium]|nr:methyltransferase domain-containing protein [Candidatus Fermentibacteria bacterium]